MPRPERAACAASGRPAALRAALTGLLLSLATGGCGAADPGPEHEARRAVERELAAANAALADVAPMAAVSARNLARVTPIATARLGTDADSHELHRYMHRCGSCHATPDPSMHTRTEWPLVVGRMAQAMDSAGLLPLGAADRAAVLRLLERWGRAGPATTPSP